MLIHVAWSHSTRSADPRVDDVGRLLIVTMGAVLGEADHLQVKHKEAVKRIEENWAAYLHETEKRIAAEGELAEANLGIK